MGGGGFEPPKALPADLQSVPFGHSGIRPLYVIRGTAKRGIPYDLFFKYYRQKTGKADDRTRTDNLLITNQLLCQLSHIGIDIKEGPACARIP